MELASVDGAAPQALGSLRKHLPRLVQLQGRAARLEDAGGPVLDLAIRLDAAELSGLAAICTVPAVQAAVDALAHVTTVRSSSASVVEAVQGWQAR